MPKPDTANNAFLAAWEKGRSAALAERPLEANPYSDRPHTKAMSRYWEDGWVDGEAERRAYNPSQQREEDARLRTADLVGARVIRLEGSVGVPYRIGRTLTVQTDVVVELAQASELAAWVPVRVEVVGVYADDPEEIPAIRALGVWMLHLRLMDPGVVRERRWLEHVKVSAVPRVWKALRKRLHLMAAELGYPALFVPVMQAGTPFMETFNFVLPSPGDAPALIRP